MLVTVVTATLTLILLVNAGEDHAIRPNNILQINGKGNEIDSNLPPLLFPTDPTTFNIVPFNVNKTALKILQHEIKINEKKVKINEKKELLNVKQNDDNVINNEIEKFQSLDTNETKIELEELYKRYPNNGLVEITKEYPVNIETIMIDLNNKSDTNNKTPIICAIMLLIICSAIYIGFVYWRKTLENRYGGREPLVLTEDFEISNDVKKYEV